MEGRFGDSLICRAPRLPQHKPDRKQHEPHTKGNCNRPPRRLTVLKAPVNPVKRVIRIAVIALVENGNLPHGHFYGDLRRFLIDFEIGIAGDIPKGVLVQDMIAVIDGQLFAVLPNGDFAVLIDQQEVVALRQLAVFIQCRPITGHFFQIAVFFAIDCVDRINRVQITLVCGIRGRVVRFSGWYLIACRRSICEEPYRACFRDGIRHGIIRIIPVHRSPNSYRQKSFQIVGDTLAEYRCFLPVALPPFRIVVSNGPAPNSTAQTAQRQAHAQEKRQESRRGAQTCPLSLRHHRLDFYSFSCVVPFCIQCPTPP